MNATIIKTHSGQYKKYNDSFYEWDVITDSKDIEEVTNFCFKETEMRRVPESAEYHKNIRFGIGEKSGDASYYFDGYYKLTPSKNGFHFTVCRPYCD